MSVPTTAFEDNVALGGWDWTTRQQGEAYLGALTGLLPNVTVESVGESVQGNPVR